jgi:hypothetical protein
MIPSRYPPIGAFEALVGADAVVRDAQQRPPAQGIPSSSLARAVSAQWR